ncbi:type IV toxin-antitoxin system AbiEi family antitoxin [Citreimonas salinaria]|uniref:Transcriptional regulator, AbiEi antitoxin, Type IV TA system n=1 Tax=Citreimonas salinaria TaxID=321339 RepID=A0A1H3LZF2_9RHOB|nr:hypothetical protein [Citreimonas salinaria]SDY69822.1 Transcriptional regulator, AbiEi antitoxin, Type IV TA system [Citreimonas salinaria]
MKSAVAVDLLEKMAKDGKYVYSTPDLRMLFTESERTRIGTLERLVGKGILVRATEASGIYVYPDGRSEGSRIRHQVALMLRQGHYSYISLESSLSAYGVIDQIPAVLTVMTTGREGKFTTPWGRIEFVHTERSPVDILTRARRGPDGNLDIALPDMALEDMKRTKRDLSLVDWEMYQEALEELEEFL